MIKHTHHHHHHHYYHYHQYHRQNTLVKQMYKMFFVLHFKVDDRRQPDVVLYASVDKSDQKRNKNNADVVMNDVIVDKKGNILALFCSFI